jgi:hypothetical protein
VKKQAIHLVIYVMFAGFVEAEDTILFTSGNEYKGEVLKYDKGLFTIRLSDGTERPAPVKNIQTILFDRGVTAANPEIAPEKPKPKLATDTQVPALEAIDNDPPRPLAPPKPMTENSICLIRVDSLSYNDEQTSAFPYSCKWLNFQLPLSDKAQKACKDITTELRQLSRAVELGVSYRNFSDLFQGTALKIDRLKIEAPELPACFIKQVDFCIFLYNQSRDVWQRAISADDKEFERTWSLFRIEIWHQADIALLYCIGIADNNENISTDILRKKADLIVFDHTVKRAHDVVRAKSTNTKPTFTPHPNVSRMSADELFKRLTIAADGAMLIDCSNN